MKKETILAVQGGIAAVGAWLSNHFGLMYPVMVILVAMMVADYISGMAASAKEAMDDPAKGWTSKRGREGIYKKFGYLLVVGAAVTVDWIIFNAVGVMGIKMPASTFFGLLTAVWFILNELLSVLENAGRMGAPLPVFLQDVIVALKSSVEHKGDGQAGKAV